MDKLANEYEIYFIFLMSYRNFYIDNIIYYIIHNKGSDNINIKQAFDRIEYGLQDQGYNLGRDYKIGHCNIDEFYIMFCKKKCYIDIIEFLQSLHYHDVLGFKFDYTQNGMRIKLRLNVDG